MKTNFFTLALMLTSAVSLAQSAFTQATLDEILAEYKTNSKAFFINRLSADFRYTTAKGAYQSRNDIVRGDAQKILKTEIAEPVIFQSGDLAVVSGTHKTERTGQDGNPAMGYIACTYTFQRRESKWLFVGSQHTSNQQDQPDSAGADEAAIKTACINLSAHFDQRDLSTMLSDLAPVPYASRYWPNNAYNGDAAIREAVTNYVNASPKPSGVKRETSNW